LFETREDNFLSKLQLGLGAGAFLFLLVLTYTHQQPPLFDEVLFVPNVHLFEQHGLTREFLVNLNNQAPGPLYEFVHLFFKPLTNLETPGIRLVNVFLLGLVILVMARIFTLLKPATYAEGLLFSVAILGVPMVWQIAGLALTEMPAMFFSLFSVLLLLLSLRKMQGKGMSLFFAISGGICLGLAILGRSPFLVLVFSAGIFLVYERSAARWRNIMLYSFFALAVSLPVFFIWGGLVPPQQSFVGKGISIWHGVLAYAYAGLMAIILAPRWFFLNKKIVFSLAALYAILALTNIYGTRYEYKPFYKSVGMILPPDMLQYYPFMISPVLATLSLYFIGCTLVHLWNRRKDQYFVYLLVTGMLLLASNFKVTHLFSTRYVGQAAAFFVLIFTEHDKWTAGRIIRILIGMVIGYFSLITYIRLA
jgi:4-amino-4-deoxy-L-arabinose transferase-like glycosyltransferase